MARVRSLKPEFFTDSELAELPPLHRIAFQGLWCHADCEGRLEDKPRELKVKILPYDACEFDRILSDLARPKRDGPGFIQRYESNGRHIIAITQWFHQKPHPKEKSADLPPPPEWNPPKRQEPENFTAEQDSAGKLQGQSGGSLVLGAGSWSLVRGSGLDAVAAMSGTRAPESVIAGAQPDNRKPDSVGAALREKPTPGKDFHLWAQIQREERRHYVAEIQKDPPGDEAWHAEAITVAGSSERLEAAYFEFLADGYWGQKGRRWPWSGFLSQWRDKYLPAKAAAPPRPKCAAPGCESHDTAVWGAESLCYVHGARALEPEQAVSA